MENLQSLMKVTQKFHFFRKLFLLSRSSGTGNRVLKTQNCNTGCIKIYSAFSCLLYYSISASWSSETLPCPWQRIGTGGSLRSLCTQAILWFLTACFHIYNWLKIVWNVGPFSILGCRGQHLACFFHPFISFDKIIWKF